MSNIEASKLYEAVIEEVISDLRQDFENSGIDETTLQELKRVWCERLSQAGVAHFSWDDHDNTNNVLAQTDIPGMSSHALSNHFKPEDLGLLELPDSLVKLEPEDYDESNGLILPRVSQVDGLGSFEMTMYTDSDVFNKLKRGKKGVQQVDGTLNEDDDDIFNDSDDINSDLDDGLESEKSDDDDADQEGQIMLCLYDKVQRVKNKWKSNLKEGVANIGGKDYVFQKATGESEW